MDLPEILKEVEKLDKESKTLKADLLKMCWYMRGGLSIDDAFALSIEEREIIAEVVKENLETTKKSGLPFF
jgi:hypothetical protein